MLGHALLTSGAITIPQLEEALDRQRETGSLLGEALLALEFISIGTLTRALAEQADVPFADLAQATPDREVAALVPESFARKRLLAPLTMNGSVLQVVQANPFDVLALDDLRQFTSRPVSAMCAPPDDVRALLDRCYAASTDDRQDPSPTLAPTAAIDRDDVPLAPTLDTGAPPKVLGLSEHGLSRKDLGHVSGLLNRSRGLVLVTGPAEAGKAVLYSMLAPLASASKRIFTIEDSVDSQIPGVRHTPINPASGFTYAAALRAMVRQYPDVIMIENINDQQTAAIALHAAQAGILVLAALPADDAIGAVVGLVDMRLEPYLLATGLTGVIAQRHVRRICPDCSEPVTYSADVLEKVGLGTDPGVIFSRGRGCMQCEGTGYRGHTGAFEVLVVDSAVQALVRERADAQAIARAAADTGMRPLREDALAKAILRQTTLEEVARLSSRSGRDVVPRIG